jgi:hypothetical protein
MDRLDSTALGWIIALFVIGFFTMLSIGVVSICSLMNYISANMRDMISDASRR